MAGVLFIINVPQKDYELEFRKINKEKTINFQEAKKVPDYPDDKPISKCNSTDCLHDKDSTSSKSRSEVSITVGENEGNKSLKTSWEEMKNTLKLRRKTLKITRPVRSIDVLDAFHWDTPLETILSEVMTRLGVRNATWCGTKNNHFWQVSFHLESNNVCEELLQVLQTFGIGSRYQSTMSVLPCSLFYKSNEEHHPTDKNNEKYDNMTISAWSRFSSSVHARTNLAQVLHDVKADAALTFDWIFQLVVAAFVASVGLVENSTVILVASMLISPLLAPITAGTLGTAVRDRSLQRIGLKHEMLGLFLALVIGFVFGLAICALDGRYGVMENWPTAEMISRRNFKKMVDLMSAVIIFINRCEVRSLWVGVMVAIPSGACVALAVLSDYTASLVGVAISASLLPPAVNAGLLWAMSLYRFTAITQDTTWLVVRPADLAMLGTASLCLTLINILCIFLSGVAVYKVKRVCSLESRDITWWRLNKNRLPSIAGRYSNNPAAWEIYSKWSNSEKSDEPCQVLNDTVTFRRPHHPRSAENIEDYFIKPQDTDIYPPDSVKRTVTGSPHIIPRSEQFKQKTNDNFCFYNLGYEMQPSEAQSPTLEPSLTLTIDSKRNCMFLGKKHTDKPT